MYVPGLQYPLACVYLLYEEPKGTVTKQVVPLVQVP